MQLAAPGPIELPVDVGRQDWVEVGMKFAWHQDSGYVGFDHTPYLTTWCCLDDVNEANGTVYMLPYDRAGTRKLVPHTADPGSTDKIGYRGSDPGDPDKCNVASYHGFFSPPATCEEIARGCRSAQIGCLDCKKILIVNVNNFLEPFRQRRSKYENMSVKDILEPGNQRAAERARQTVAQVRELMKI